MIFNVTSPSVFVGSMIVNFDPMSLTGSVIVNFNGISHPSLMTFTDSTFISLTSSNYKFKIIFIKFIRIDQIKRYLQSLQ